MIKSSKNVKLSQKVRNGEKFCLSKNLRIEKRTCVNQSENGRVKKESV